MTNILKTDKLVDVRLGNAILYGTNSEGRQDTSFTGLLHSVSIWPLAIPIPTAIDLSSSFYKSVASSPEGLCEELESDASKKKDCFKKLFDDNTQGVPDINSFWIAAALTDGNGNLQPTTLTLDFGVDSKGVDNN